MFMVTEDVLVAMFSSCCCLCQ